MGHSGGCAVAPGNQAHASRHPTSPQLDGKRYASYAARFEGRIVQQMLKADGGSGDYDELALPMLGVFNTLLKVGVGAAVSELPSSRPGVYGGQLAVLQPSPPKAVCAVVNLSTPGAGPSTAAADWPCLCNPAPCRARLTPPGCSWRGREWRRLAGGWNSMPSSESRVLAWQA